MVSPTLRPLYGPIKPSLCWRIAPQARVFPKSLVSLIPLDPLADRLPTFSPFLLADVGTCLIRTLMSPVAAFPFVSLIFGGFFGLWFRSQIFEYNGSAVVAMVGKNCFAIASDRRLGVNLQTIATDFQRIYKIHDKLYIGLSGLATDAQTLWVYLSAWRFHSLIRQRCGGLSAFFFSLLFGAGRYQRLVFRHKLYQLREERDMKPQTFASLVSALLYEKRFVLRRFLFLLNFWTLANCWYPLNFSAEVGK